MNEMIERYSAKADGDHAIMLSALEALCTRLCHDLSGPLAGVKAGAELLEEDGNPELLALTLRSIEELSRHLIWFRSSFAGLLAPVVGTSLSEAIQSVRQWLTEGKIILDKDVEEIAKQFTYAHPDWEQSYAKIFPLMVADVRSMLPRGGRLTLLFSSREQSPHLRLGIGGPRVVVHEDWMKVFEGDFTCLSEKTIAAFMAAVHAQRLGLKLTAVKSAANVIELTAVSRL